MPQNDVVISKAEGGLQRQDTDTFNIRGLVANMGAVAPTGLAAGVSTKLFSVADAEALGIDNAYDLAQGVFLHYDIKRFFWVNPGAALWLRLVAQSVTLSDMVDSEATPNCAAYQLQLDAGGEIKRFALRRNPASGYTPTITNGFDTDVHTAAAKADALAVKMAAEHMDAGFIIEGYAWSGNPTTTYDLRTYEYPNVNICVHKDLDATPGGGGVAKNNNGDIGTILGVSSKARCNENIGWVEKFNVADAALGYFVNPGFIGGLAMSSFSTAQLNTLNDKGYIYLRKFIGVSGVYFNDSHSCCANSSDFAYMENVDTMNKAIRLVYAKLIRKTNAPLRVDANGHLSPEVGASFESLGLQALQPMFQAEEISAMDVYVNLNQNILTSSELAVKIDIVPIGTNRKMSVTIGFTVSVSQ